MSNRPHQVAIWGYAMSEEKLEKAVALVKQMDVPSANAFELVCKYGAEEKTLTALCLQVAFEAGRYPALTKEAFGEFISLIVS